MSGTKRIDAENPIVLRALKIRRADFIFGYSERRGHTDRHTDTRYVNDHTDSDSNEDRTETHTEYPDSVADGYD